MGKPVLLMRLEGPLQAWGLRSRWDVRDTGPEPSKSGVIGLLGCALGYPVGDARLEELDRGLRFGVRVESPGRVLVDYQTITDFLPAAKGGYKVAAETNPVKQPQQHHQPATIISPRSYLEDAAFLVALEETGAAPPRLLHDCTDHLRSPRWPIYLGRKACVPTRPVFESFTNQYDGIEDALRHHPWSWLGARMQPRTPPERLRIWVEDPAGTHLRQDAIRVNLARQYGFRHATELAPIVPPGQQGGTA